MPHKKTGLRMDQHRTATRSVHGFIRECGLLTPLQELDSRQPLNSLAMPDDHDSHDKPVAVPSPPEWPGECEACRQIWRLFAQPESTHKLKLGSFEEVLATQCHTHGPLVQEFTEYLHERSPTTGSDGVGIYRSEEHSLTIKQSLSKSCPIWSLLLMKKDSVPHHPGTGRILNPDWADLGMLKYWKQQCLSTHGAKCENPMRIWRTRPAYLIDVERKCIVPGLVSDAFVALSYRYGRSSGTTIDAATLEKLQQPHALDALEFEEHMSPIIRHAMYLTSIISERYLWADALCIPQANEEVRNEELKMMGAIYANAVVTIIAADGDSQDGLPGLESVSEPRRMNQRIIPFDTEKIILNDHMRLGASLTDAYESRGWTFQEYRMSQRRIIFKDRRLHWQCRCGVWYEDMILGAEIDRSFSFYEQSVIMSGFPDLSHLSQIIFNYNGTELRYDEDALPAVSGLLSVLSRSFTGGFLYGIPEMFFDRGLGWRPACDSVNIRRRTLSERSVENRLSPSELPSWSWIGWQGWVNFCEEGEASATDWPYLEETIPVTEWYTSNSYSDPLENRRRISSTWFENRDRYKDLAQPLPPGWSRHDAPVKPRLHPEKCGKYVFSHANWPSPENKTKYWNYPFPVAGIQDSTPPFTPEQTPYLFCKTSRARLWGRQIDRGNITHLYNSSGRAVGYLHLHNKDSLALFPRTEPEAGHGLPVELVVVYKSRKYIEERRKNAESYDHLLEMEDGNVVLWVEWTDGVAYRLASGKVKTKEWEKLDTESIDLVLG